MIRIEDQSVIQDLLRRVADTPLPQKQLSDRVIYRSMRFGPLRKVELPVLADFGQARLGDEVHFDDIQPRAYRAPEVILNAGYSYSADIWNLGCLVSTVPDVHPDQQH